MKKTDGREIEIAILNNEYKVVVCWGSESFCRRVLKKRGHIANVQLNDFRGRTYYTRGYHPLIILHEQPTTTDLLGTLAHEAVHAMEYIYDTIGEQPSGEVFAHSVGAIVRITLQKSNKTSNNIVKTTRG